jgi:two-component system response regulator AtoC
MKTNILIIDGISSIRICLEDFMSSRFHLEWAAGNSDVVPRIAKLKPAVVLMDIMFPDIDGIALLEEITLKCPASKIIVVTQFQNMDFIIKASRLGVYDYVPKEISPRILEEMINKASKIAGLENKLPDLSNESSCASQGSVIVGQSEAIRNIFKLIGNISNSRVTVAILGETGTGKELVARVIHENSPAKDEPFVAVDCTTIVETLAESTLFGHQKGAFTGAVESHKGKFEIAGSGTIFFDEVSELPLDIQGKLLRFLQEKEFDRVGGERRHQSNARIIAATNRALSQLVKQGRFRKDLYFRLKVLTLHLPPLRERKEDIQLLITHFASKIKRVYGVPSVRIEDSAIRLLQEYSWPGNVREMENLLTRLAIMAQGEMILEETVEEHLETSRNLDPFDKQLPTYSSLAEVEKKAIQETLSHTRWNITSAARILSISRPTLRKKIKEYQLRP